MELGNSNIFEANPQNFQKEVAERSRSMPVLLFFWVAQMPTSVTARKALEGLMPAYQGKAALALVDAAREQMLVQQLRIQNLPALRVVHQGQMVEQLDGPQSERVYKKVLDQLTMSSGEMLRASLEDVLAARDFNTALQILESSIQAEPNNPAFRVELADVLARAGEVEEARKALASIPDDAPDRKRPMMRIEFAEEAAGLDDVTTLRNKLSASPNDLETRYALCIQLVAEERYEEAMELGLEIVRKDRTFRDDIGRLMLIRIFDLLGKGAPLAATFRRRMFNYLH